MKKSVIGFWVSFTLLVGLQTLAWSGQPLQFERRDFLVNNAAVTVIDTGQGDKSDYLVVVFNHGPNSVSVSTADPAIGGVLVTPGCSCILDNLPLPLTLAVPTGVGLATGYFEIIEKGSKSEFLPAYPQGFSMIPADGVSRQLYRRSPSSTGSLTTEVENLATSQGSIELSLSIAGPAIASLAPGDGISLAYSNQELWAYAVGGPASCRQWMLAQAPKNQKKIPPGGITTPIFKGDGSTCISKLIHNSGPDPIVIHGKYTDAQGNTHDQLIGSYLMCSSVLVKTNFTEIYCFVPSNPAYTSGATVDWTTVHSVTEHNVPNGAWEFATTVFFTTGQVCHDVDVANTGSTTLTVDVTWADGRSSTDTIKPGESMSYACHITRIAANSTGSGGKLTLTTEEAKSDKARGGGKDK